MGQNPPFPEVMNPGVAHGLKQQPCILGALPGSSRRGKDDWSSSSLLS